MTCRAWSALLIASMCLTWGQALAQDLVSPKLVPPAAVLREEVATRNLAFATDNDSANTTATPRRHWTKAGKIMTIVGAGLIGAGTGALIHGQNTHIACNNGTCVDVAWRATGAIW